MINDGMELRLRMTRVSTDVIQQKTKTNVVLYTRSGGEKEKGRKGEGNEGNEGRDPFRMNRTSVPLEPEDRGFELGVDDPIPREWNIEDEWGQQSSPRKDVKPIWALERLNLQKACSISVQEG